MITELFKSYLQLSSSNIISDEVESIRYKDIPDLFSIIDRSYDVGKLNGCMALMGSNKISFTVFLLYLLANEKSFYVSSSYSVNGQIPSFCSHTITIPEKNHHVASKNHHEVIIEPSSDLKLRELSAGKPRSVYFATSGSTGDKKIIRYTHDKLLQNAAGCIDRFELSSKCRVLICVPAFHMYGLGAGLLPSLIANAIIKIVDGGNILKIYEQIRKFNPDLLYITPTQAKMLIRLGKDLGKRRFICAGEKISPQDYIQFEERYGLLINLYGSSELGAVATTMPAHTLELRSEGVFVPLKGVEISFSGGGNQGEIRCSHPSGFEEYVDQTGESIPTLAIGKMYSTKDLGSRMGADRFKVIGRTDNILNRSGFLISIEELEISIKNHCKDVAEVIVFEREDEQKIRNELIAVYTKVNDHQEIELSILQACTRNLPTYCRPDRLINLNNLPLTATGKPDRMKIKKIARQL
ncbi:fatty acid--CoA ligase family protein [Olivibacter sp. CPCC 100613]|uniref:class I adenylate-forming enzyme family protein n=1 Tax=Olivibacter sp. CPCC 100613 TaxID=3079931 RepID=UPI002FF7EA9A